MLNAFHLSLHANFGDLLIQPVSKFESTASIGYAVTQITRNWSSTETDKLIILFFQKFPVTKTERVSTLHITYSWGMVDTLRCTDSIGGYACQLSCIVRESHACRLRTSISYFKDSFSNLPHKSRQIVLKYVMSDKSLIQFPQLIFQALNDDFCVPTKSKHAKVGVFYTSFESAQRPSEHLRKFSWRSTRLPKMYRKPREFTGTVMFVERQKSDTFDQKKLAGIEWLVSYQEKKPATS